MDSTQELTVGFIGLGVMGAPMCRNLMRRMPRAHVVVFDRSPEAIEAVTGEGAGEGAGIAASPQDVAGRAQVILLSLPDGDAVRAVVDAMIGAIRPGTIVIDTSTSPVDVTREMAAQIRAAGGDYLDAPIARTRAAAENGTLDLQGVHQGEHVGG